MKEMNSSIKSIIASCLILVLMLPSAASSELILPTDTNKFVIDEAGVLSQTDEDLLTVDLQWLADEWGTDIVVVVIESTAHYQSNDDNSGDTTDNNTNGTGNGSTNQTIDEPMMELKEFSEALFDDWGVGNQEWQDGILLVLSINQSSDDSNWWFVTGNFWEEYWVFNGVGATSDDSNDAGNWTELLLIITDDLVTAVDEFWIENDGYVYPPEDQSDTDSTEPEMICVDAYEALIADLVTQEACENASQYNLWDDASYYSCQTFNNCGGTFVCDSGQEISMILYDDGQQDCWDGSDEPVEGIGIKGDIDIWFEQWNDSAMEFVIVQRMVMDDAESIASFAYMADTYFGNDDGEVTQDEVDILNMFSIRESEESLDMAEHMRLDGNPGLMVDAWVDVEGLIEGDSELVVIIGQVVAFDTTAYADSTTHTFTIGDIEDDSSEDNISDDEGCDVDSIWIHNSDTWSVSSVSDSANNMSFAYEEFNNAWFTEDCPDDSGTVTFNLVKTDGGELPDATEDNDWEDLDTNRFPICAYAYAMMLPDGEFDVRVGIGAAPESGDYIIDLVDGAKYMISVVCSDPEGEYMTVTINNGDLNLTSTYTSTATAEASLMLSVPAGYDGTYVFDVTWTDGYHVESGNLTIIGLGDGSNDDDISADGDGFLPGFTAALGIVALLGAAMIGSRRNRA